MSIIIEVVSYHYSFRPLKFIFSIAIACFTPVLLFSQHYVRGEVKDEGGSFLQNVSIRHNKTGYVYYTGMSGGFGIQNNARLDTFTFSFDGFEPQSLQVDANLFNSITLKKAPKVTKYYKLASLTANLRFENQKQWLIGDESYASTIENGFISADKYAVTGLTLNVDRAAYSNIRRFINTKKPVPPDAVRIEEMLNYFNFKYTEPANGEIFQIHSALTECPWNPDNQLLFARITSKKVPLDKLPPSHLVFLIDISASMDVDNRLPLLKAGFHGLVNNLRAQDSVSIVVYGGTVGVLLRATSGANKQKIINAIDSIQPGGSTPGESGVKLAYSVARQHFIKGGNNRVILATDGDFNVGVRSESDLEQLISEQKEGGIYLTCLGVGMGNYKDSKIQALAQKGNGNFAYIDSYAEAEKVLLKEFTQTLYTVADDVHLNVQFNPAEVKEYRLIGFDNKVGAVKDTTASIEGGEVGSSYSILAAFEIVPQQKIIKEQQPAQFTLHYLNAGQNNKRQVMESRPLLGITAFDSLAKEYQFASAVIMFGSLLKESRYAKNMVWEKVLAIASQSADLANPSQVEFINLVNQAKELYSKKRKKVLFD
jgi:Ca-activated chloride channel family protein